MSVTKDADRPLMLRKGPAPERVRKRLEQTDGGENGSRGSVADNKTDKHKII